MLGVTLALSWGRGLVLGFVWRAALAATRISSVSGMSAAISAPIAASLIGQMVLGYALLLLALIVIWKHSANIGRLIDGTEPKVGRSRE